MPAPLTLCALLLLTRVASTLAQTPIQSPASFVQASLDRMTQADAAQSHFTRFDLEHTVNHDKRGKLTSQFTALYEDTWINDLPYKRLIEWNGQPLSGPALDAEQARFDTAVASRQKLDLADRAVLMRQVFTHAEVRINKILTPDYRLTELPPQTLNGQSVHVLQAEPLPSTPAHPIPQQRFQLWITDANPALLRVTCSVLDEEPALPRGTLTLSDYQIIDTLPLLSHETYHGLVHLGKRLVIVDSEHTYTRYRRFTTTVTLKSTPDPD